MQRDQIAALRTRILQLEAAQAESLNTLTYNGTAWTTRTTPLSATRTLLFADECNGAAGTRPDPAKWGVEVGRLGGSSELQNYTANLKNAQYNGKGQLALTAYKEVSGTAQYSSGRLYARGSTKPFSFTFGRIEARIKVPASQGMFPAFWTIGDYNVYGWPQCGEIDVMETVNKAREVHGSIHVSGDDSTFQSSPDPSGSLGNAFHIYAAEWTATSITWFLDGVRYAKYAIPSGSILAGKSGHSPVLNLAIGGGWAGPPDATTIFPATMLVDYVRIYR